MLEHEFMDCHTTQNIHLYWDTVRIVFHVIYLSIYVLSEYLSKLLHNKMCYFTVKIIPMFILRCMIMLKFPKYSFWEEEKVDMLAAS